MSGSRTLKVTILGDASGAQRAMADTEVSAGGLLARFEGLSGGVGKLSSLLTGALGGAGFAAMNAAMGGVAAAFAGVKNSVINTNAELEQSTVSWGVLLGSTEKAQAKLADLSKFAAQTPFDFPGVQKASLLLQTFGGDALNTTKTLTLVGDVAAGVNQPFEDVAMWTGRMYSAMKNGQPFGEAAARLQEMGAMSGETRLKLEQMQKAGVSADQMWAAFSDSMGRFGGMMEKQSKTFVGQMSTMQDSLNMLAAQAGRPIFDLLTVGLGKVNALLSSDAVTHGVARFATGLQSGIGAVGDFGRYLRAVADDGDSLNDWLTHLPAQVRPLVQAFGTLTATARQVGTILTRRDFVGGGWLAEDSPLVTGLFALLRAFDLGRDAIQTFRAALRGEWFGGQTQSINAFVRTLGRGVQLARDSVLTLREALAGQWTQGGAGNDLVNLFGRVGLAVRGAWQAVKPFIPDLLILGRAITTITSPILSFAKAWVQTGGDVRSALNLMRRQVQDGLLALGDLLRRVGPPLARALWGFLGDAAGDFGRAWQANDINGKVRRFLGEQLPRLAGGALGLGKRLWAGLGDLAGQFADWWRDNGVTGKITERLSRFLGGLGDLGGAIWAGLGDLAGKFGQWWTDNGMTEKVRAKAEDLLGKLGDFAGSIWAGLTDLAGKFEKWWTDNGMTQKVKDKLGDFFSKLGDFGAGIYDGLGDLAKQFGDWWTKNDTSGKIGRFLGDEVPVWIGYLAGALFNPKNQEPVLAGGEDMGKNTGSRFQQGLKAVFTVGPSVTEVGDAVLNWLGKVDRQIVANVPVLTSPTTLGDAVWGWVNRTPSIEVVGNQAIAWFDQLAHWLGEKVPALQSWDALGTAILTSVFSGPSVEEVGNTVLGWFDDLARWLTQKAPALQSWGTLGDAIKHAIFGGTPQSINGVPVSPGFGAGGDPGGGSAGNNISNAPATPTFAALRTNSLAAGMGGGIVIQSLSLAGMTFAPVYQGITPANAGQLLADDFLKALQAGIGQGVIMPIGGVS